MVQLIIPILLALPLSLTLVVLITQGGGERGEARALATLSGITRLNREVKVILEREISPLGLVPREMNPLLKLIVLLAARSSLVFSP